MYTIITALLLTALPAFAQVVIEPDDIPMGPGTVFTYQIAADPDGIGVDVGQSGENRQYDFTQFDMEFDDIISDTLLEPEDAPDIDIYEESNRILYTNSALIDFGVQTVIQYEQVSDDGWLLLGVVPQAGEGGPPFELPLDFRENPITMMPLPAEYEDEWNIALEMEFPLEVMEEWGEEFALLDSIIIGFALGGFVEIDGWGTALYSGGEVDVIRQHAVMGGEITVIGVRYIFNQRIAIELPFGFELQTAHTYRWLAPDVGEIAVITSLPLEEDPDFNLASEVKVRYLPPALAVEQPSIDFGEVHLGNSSLAFVAVQNEGVGSGAITGIEFSGGLENEIEPLEELPIIIDPDDWAPVRFLWTPEGERDLEGETIELFHNDPTADNPIVITLHGGTPNGIVEADGLPSQMSLSQNYPNPFNSQTAINFTLPHSDWVTLDVVDVTGKRIERLLNGSITAGEHEYLYSADNIAPGVYFYRLSAGSSELVRKMVYVK